MTTESRTAHVSIHPETSVGMLSLTVSDLNRSLAFYTDAIGFEVIRHHQGGAELGVAGEPILVLHEHPAAEAWPRGGQSYTGLYHFALLLPSRADLGAWVKHWLDLGYPIGQGDHLVSEALYLEDPDGHGIEIYRDRPRDQWHWENGRVRMAADPVDIKGMIDEAEQQGKVFTTLPHGTRLGHVHLQVGDIPEAERFYHHVLGFDVVASMPSALFVSAGGYHHHIGMNTWHSRGASPAPDGSVRLNHFTIDLANELAMREVIARLEAAGVGVNRNGALASFTDPFDNGVVLRLKPGASS
jgi:catechol 2,3-dioxygenase